MRDPGKAALAACGGLLLAVACDSGNQDGVHAGSDGGFDAPVDAALSGDPDGRASDATEVSVDATEAGVAEAGVCLAGPDSDASIIGVCAGPSLLEHDDVGGVAPPQLAMDPAGNTTVVWSQSDGTRFNLWANRYNAATGSWGTATLIETDNAGDVESPQVAADGDGNVIAVWIQYDGALDHIRSNRYTAATGTWGTAALIETSKTEDAIDPQIAIDGDGNAAAVWLQYDGLLWNVHASRYTVATGTWGATTLIETDNGGDAFVPQIAVDGTGNFLAVWTLFDGVQFNVYGNRYTAATASWGTAAAIESVDTQGISLAQVAVTGNGDATVVWRRPVIPQDNLWAARYTAATGSWSSAGLIASGNHGDVGLPQVAIDGDGDATAIWAQSDGKRLNIWSNRYTSANASWDTAVLIESNGDGDALSPQITLDKAGNAFAVWHQSDGKRYNVWGNRYTAATGSWGTATLLESNDTGDSLYPQVAVNGGGGLVIVVWSTSDGMRFSLWGNRYR